jgi:hypothetical protein
MHPRTMKRLAVGFAGACSLLLACTVHDDTTFPNLPETTQTPPTRSVLDAGLVILYDDGGEGVPGVGGGGTYTPDAAEVVDVAPDAATPDLGGLGSFCDVFADACKPPNQCYPNPSTGNGICDDPSDRDLPQSANCSPTASTCGPHLFCGTGFCTNLCHPDDPSSNECSAGTICTRLKQFINVGYCSN